MEKPFKTIDQQIRILNERGVVTDEMTAPVLKREGYYPVVNGYKDPFLDAEASGAGEDVYLPGTKFSDMYRLYRFDRDLRMTFMRYFAVAEATLKTVCSYKFTERHPNEPNPYLVEGNYNEWSRSNGKASELIVEFGKAIGLHEESIRWKRKEYLKHYIEHHNGEVPLWVLMNFASLGQAFKFFCFMDDRLQGEVAKAYSSLYSDTHDKAVKIYPRRLRLAYDHIKDFRNICAHDERMYCARVAPSSDISLENVMHDLELVLPKGDYAALVRKTVDLLLLLLQDLESSGECILRMMGITSISKTFFVND